MKKTIIALAFIALAFSLAGAPSFAQTFMTRTGRVSFFSATPVENIQAVNNEASAVLDAKTGALQFIVPVKSFKMEKALMQEHFNENYMESDKFPKAEFKGRITNMSVVNMAKDGDYKVQVAGKMTIHGVTRDIFTPGTVTVKAGMPAANGSFNVKCADYGIKIPSVVSSKIAEDIQVTVAAPMAATGR